MRESKEKRRTGLQAKETTGNNMCNQASTQMKNTNTNS
jgi:hypothetical protein